MWKIALTLPAISNQKRTGNSDREGWLQWTLTSNMGDLEQRIQLGCLTYRNSELIGLCGFNKHW